MFPPRPTRLFHLQFEAGSCRGISDRDLAALVAWLRTIPPVRHAVDAKSQYPFPLTPHGPEMTTVPDPPADDPVARGRYIAVNLAHCMDCHSAQLSEGRADPNGRGARGLVLSRDPRVQCRRPTSAATLPKGFDAGPITRSWLQSAAASRLMVAALHRPRVVVRRFGRGWTQQTCGPSLPTCDLSRRRGDDGIGATGKSARAMRLLVRSPPTAVVALLARGYRVI
jgi:hypothetical protein